MSTSPLSLLVPWIVHCFGNVENEFVQPTTIRPFHTFFSNAEELPHTSQVFVHGWASVHVGLSAFSPISWTNRLFKPCILRLVFQSLSTVLLFSFDLLLEFPKRFLTGDTRTGKNVLNTCRDSTVATEGIWPPY